MKSESPPSTPISKCKGDILCDEDELNRALAAVQLFEEEAVRRAARTAEEAARMAAEAERAAAEAKRMAEEARLELQKTTAMRARLEQRCAQVRVEIPRKRVREEAYIFFAAEDQDDDLYDDAVARSASPGISWPSRKRTKTSSVMSPFFDPGARFRDLSSPTIPSSETDSDVGPWSPEPTPAVFPRDATYAPSERFETEDFEVRPEMVARELASLHRQFRLSPATPMRESPDFVHSPGCPMVSGPSLFSSTFSSSSSSPSSSVPSSIQSSNRYSLRRGPSRPIPSVEGSQSSLLTASRVHTSAPAPSQRERTALVNSQEEYDWDIGIPAGSPSLEKLLAFAVGSRAQFAAKACIIGFVPRFHSHDPFAAPRYPVKGVSVGQHLQLYVYRRDLDGNELEAWDETRPFNTVVSTANFWSMGTLAPQFRGMTMEQIRRFLAALRKDRVVPKKADIMV